MTIDAPKPFHLPSLKALWKEAFGDTDAFLDTFEKSAFSYHRCRCVTDGDTGAAALYWFDCSYEEGRIAYLYAIATAKSHRGRGLCRALMEDTHKHLKKMGYSGQKIGEILEKLSDAVIDNPQYNTKEKLVNLI